MKSAEKTPKYSMSQKEKDELFDNIQRSIDSFNIAEPKLSKEEQMWIRKATNCGSDRLYNQGSLFAYTAIENHYRKAAIKYQDTGRTEVEDLLSELYIAVHINISKYDGIHSLFTFFEPIVRSTFMIARGTGRGGGMSKYYQDVGVTIKRAEQELMAEGFSSPSILDIRDYIKVKFNGNISESTIERYYRYSQNVESIDASEKQYAAVESVNPETQALDEERKIEFYQGVHKLPPRHRLLVTKELEYIANYGVMPSVQALFDMMVDECSDLTLHETTQMQRAAHIELRGYFSRKKRREVPVNSMRTLTNDFDLIVEDEQNVLDAVSFGNLDDIIPKGKPYQTDQEEEVNLDIISL